MAQVLSLWVFTAIGVGGGPRRRFCEAGRFCVGGREVMQPGQLLCRQMVECAWSGVGEGQRVRVCARCQ
jgi:hypothetical protein